MQTIFGILMMFIGAASGLLFQDPVVCKFNKNDQCYVALGERLHLQIPPADWFNLNMRDMTSADRTIIRFRNNNLVYLENHTRWQFVKENNTMILTSAERSDSGTYSLDTSDAGGALTGRYTLQLHTEAQVSSVSVWYKCLASEDIKVHCSAEGDNLTYSWTSDFNTLSLLENGISTLTLNKGHHGNITCYVKNHVSQSHNSTVLQPCPEPTTTPTISVSTSSNFTSFEYTVIFLSVFCVLIILIFIVVFYVYRKNKGKKSEAAPPQGDRELVYTEVNHKRQNRSEPTAGTSHVQDDNVEYAAVAIEGSKRKTKKNEDEVQYGELVFNTPAKNKSKGPKVQDDDCVYSQVHHSR
ncbi:hypothetical protein HF521_004881 [Silurus meridionalis]|uniref:Ig-like domain-containing protein n=1 Tax=Silurus meridionalis TaxID=175797 RepID=A0A8T0B353_SILME|nr:hypothetical protein HF521_004881 [Silurus meridionalis]